MPEISTGFYQDDPLDQIIADYLEEIEKGAVPDRAALLVRHPELAERLWAFMADYDRIAQHAGELKLGGATTDHNSNNPALTHVRYFGDFELLELIARGGMGVVYKARQTSLRRLVALKMILQGLLATPRDMARFRLEAEAAANLDHPHIVPIYEIGEHQGRQYFTMRFIEGPSLANHPRGTAKVEVGLIAILARAVHYAHQRGILHRDIKPSNVLLQVGRAAGQTASEPAEVIPFVADFGLAKRLDVVGDLTGTGLTPGTPRYMAPEQAAGRKDLTVAADVYSLGVVLYERLTGATPFGGDDLLELLRQVREVEAPKPSNLVPGLDHDLETVCLKCLEKSPEKRYATAEALADDLGRWLRGEPIVARPVGTFGRFTRWCRRNPAVAGLTGAVAASLLAGTVISMVFGVHAHLRRLQAEAAQEGMEREMALGLLAPLDADPPDRPGTEGYSDSLNLAERESLWRLAETSNERVRRRFLVEALATESTSHQLLHGAGWFVHAAVGLDLERRAWAQTLFEGVLRDPAKSISHRADVASAYLELFPRNAFLQGDCAKLIGQEWEFEEDPEKRQVWQYRILSRLESFSPTEAANLVNQMLTDSEEDKERQGLADHLVEVAARMQPPEAFRMLSSALAEEEDRFVRDHWIEGLVSVTAQMEPSEAARLCETTAQMLTQALMKEDASARSGLARALAVVTAPMEPAEAARICGPVAQFLFQALAKEKVPAAHQELAADLVAVASRMRPTEAARMLWQAFAEEKDSQPRQQFATGLAALAVSLDRAEAARVCGDAARTLCDALVNEKDAYSCQYLAEGLAATATRMEPAEAARLLAHSIANVKYADARQKLVAAIATIATRLEPTEAKRVCRDAAQALYQEWVKEKDAGARQQLATDLTVLAGRMQPSEATLLLCQGLSNEPDAYIRRQFAQSLAAVAGGLQPAEAERVCGETAQMLNQALAEAKDAYVRDQLANGLPSLAARMEIGEAARVCAEAAKLLGRALAEEKDAKVLRPLVDDLAAVADWMEPAERARVFGKAARVLSQAILEEKDASSQKQLDEALAAVVCKLKPGEAQRILKGCIRKLSSNGNGNSEAVENWKPEVLSRLLVSSEGPDALAAKAVLAQYLVANPWLKGPVIELQEAMYGWNLRFTLIDATRQQDRRWAMNVAAACGSGSGCGWSSLMLMPQLDEAWPCLHSTQMLVDLLKFPTCVGESRRVVLEQLGNRYGRRFETHWEFVEYAKEHALDLDFTTPPKRPQRRLPPLFSGN